MKDTMVRRTVYVDAVSDSRRLLWREQDPVEHARQRWSRQIKVQCKDSVTKECID